jgi:hypothetical protein
LKTTYQQEVSLTEFNEARNILRASEFPVSFHSDPTVQRSQSAPLFATCFNDNIGSDNSHSSRKLKEMTYFGKGRVVMQKQTKADNNSGASNLNLVVEVYALNIILLSRTVIPFRDIVEIRTGLDAYQLRKLKNTDSSKVATLFSDQMCIQLEFGSASNRNEFVKCCRKISKYCRVI